MKSMGAENSRYASDLMDVEWESIEAFLPLPGSIGRPRTTDVREVAERTFAWLERCRRLAKDFEATMESAVARITIAGLRIITRRLTRV